MSSSRHARAAVAVGILALAAIPAAVAASHFSNRIGTLFSVAIGVPVALALGLIGLALARRAAFRLDRSVVRAGERTVRIARFVVWASLYVAVTGALALGFYGALRARS